MLGELPTSVTVNGEVYPINTDYRAALAIMEAFNDPALSGANKMLTMLEILYRFRLPPDLAEAQRQALWFLDAGQPPSDGYRNEPRTIDWVKDEQLLFAAVNDAAGQEVRAMPYLHWWTFTALCKSISPDAAIVHLVHIRRKLHTGQKLDKWEAEFYRANKEFFEPSYEEMMRALTAADRRREGNSCAG